VHDAARCKYGLNISRYLDSFEERDAVDIDAIQKDINTLESELLDLQARMREHLLGLTTESERR
jgi:type I restriction enzyme M protein